MDTEVNLFESPNLTPIFFSLMGFDKGRNLQKKVNKRDEILASIFCAAVRIKKCEDQLKQKIKRSSYTSCKMHLGWLWDIQTFILNCNKFIISA
jgi:hypothetical protein